MASKKCPICGEPTSRTKAAYPFCSARCQLIDLGNWSSEAYSVPGKPTEADNEAGIGQPPATDLIQ